MAKQLRTPMTVEYGHRNFTSYVPLAEPVEDVRYVRVVFPGVDWLRHVAIQVEHDGTVRVDVVGNGEQINHPDMTVHPDGSFTVRS